MKAVELLTETILYAFMETIHEVAQRHPVLENYKDELLQTFVEHLEGDRELVEKYSSLSDNELKDRAKKVLETVIENTVLETVLNRLDYINKKIDDLRKDIGEDHTILAKGLNNVAKTVGIYGKHIKGQVENVERNIEEVKNRIDKAKEEIKEEVSKEISDATYYLSR